MGRTEASRWLQAAVRKTGGAKGPLIDAGRWALTPSRNPQSRLTETVRGKERGRLGPVQAHLRQRRGVRTH